MKTVVVIQARMGSSRFPGKVLADLDGEPILAFMLRRLAPLEKNGIVDALVVATSTQPENDAIEMLCHDRGVYCYRGSEDDVLSRFRDVVADTDARTIVRLTADCPLVWAGLVEHALKAHNDAFCVTTVDVEGFDVEVFDWFMLSKATSAEHVTKGLNRRFIQPPKLSVDWPEDLERVREFFGC
jgi:spore coat polysaccharide biosynthesis protein SpsF (cytidylyltransferase family)